VNVGGLKTVIYGSRPDGQANVVAQLARAQGTLQLVGLVDDVPENRGRIVEGLTVIGTGEELEELRAGGVEALLIGFGEGLGRADAVARALAAGLELPTLVHPTAVCFPSAQLGRGAQVFPLAVIGADARIGDGALVNTGAVVDHNVVLEDGAVVLPNATLAGRVRVGRDSTIGAGASVLPDRAIGAEAVVGAGSVVLEDVPDGVRVAGVPARPLGGHSGA
jgi:sugar O-acyltransferase (sialic acid O-acetyltransferase NeuD family)